VHVSPYVLDHGIACLSGLATIHICMGQPKDLARLSLMSLGHAQVNVSEPLPSPDGGRQVIVDAVREAECTSQGRAVHWCLVKGEMICLCCPLQSAMSVKPGNVFDLPSFTVIV
jgi:hypothetical protein